MKWIHSSNHESTIEKVGGKGLHLQKLKKWKARVAPFLVITTDTFDHYVLTNEFPVDLKDKIKNFISQHETVALRSSMIGEDHLDASFAGLFETFLGVTENNWEEKLKNIYSSVNSERVLQYINQKNIQTTLKMAVVIQKQITVDKSGVLFTRSPVNPTSAIAIDAAFGMGEGVVSGLVDVDHYLMTRLGEKISGPNDGVLTSDQLKDLIHEGLRLESTFGKPADIEWGLLGNDLYIFQIRPITRTFPQIKVFADTNLSESYPGNVSPFTASFVKRAYENVFTESAIILGAQGERLDVLKSHYAHLICHVDDHLYYDLEHYYAVLRALPGGEKNIDNWHKMIGGKMEGTSIPYHSTLLSNFETAMSLYKLAEFAWKKDNRYKNFLMDMDQLSKDISFEIKNLNTSSAIIQYLHNLVQKPLGFGLTVANDVFIMIGLSLLSRQMKQKGLTEDNVIDVLKTSQNLDSMKPLEAFEELTASLTSDFILAFERYPTKEGLYAYKEVFRHLEDEGWTKEVIAIRKFLEIYGDRSFEELKIESLPLKNDPQLFKLFLSWGKRTQATHHKKSEEAHFEFGLIDQKILTFTRECISFRESSRLWRGRFYHLLRELMLKLAETLTLEDPKWSQWGLRDFFSLNHSEWSQFQSGSLSYDRLFELMLERKEWQVKDKTYPELLSWVPDEKLPEIKTSVTLGPMKGYGVSPGIVEGRALVLENPIDAMESNLEKFILVTKNTDPAWVYIMSRSLALISEKGSLLSHTAIIGRELGIPTVVGLKNSTQTIQTGDLIRVDGSSGEVTKL